ncbi:MAG: hypothetical protein MPJ50_11955 [Pirellulales bacterium]|nr:hypothetical protein [Pirellulales bacterium]
MHCLFDDSGKAITALVAASDQAFDVAADLVECVADVSSVFPRELDDFDGVPDNVE